MADAFTSGGPTRARDDAEAGAVADSGHAAHGGAGGSDVAASNDADRVAASSRGTQPADDHADVATVAMNTAGSALAPAAERTTRDGVADNALGDSYPPHVGHSQSTDVADASHAVPAVPLTRSMRLRLDGAAGEESAHASAGPGHGSTSAPVPITADVAASAGVMGSNDAGASSGGADGAAARIAADVARSAGVMGSNDAGASGGGAALMARQPASRPTWHGQRT